MPDIKATTQEHLDILTVQDGFVLLKNGGACAGLQTTAVNFDLLSEAEQDAMITAYSALLNSLSFPIQVVIRSKRMDISSYLEKLQAAENRQLNPHFKEKMRSYRNYVSQLISRNNVLDKRFYIVIPFLPLSLAPKGGIFSNLLGGKSKVKIDKRALLEKSKNHLDPKVEHLMKQLSRIGIKSKRLNTQEWVELYYDIYNPQISHTERLRTSVQEYTVPLVEPAIEPVSRE